MEVFYLISNRDWNLSIQERNSLLVKFTNIKKHLYEKISYQIQIKVDGSALGLGNYGAW